MGRIGGAGVQGLLCMGRAPVCLSLPFSLSQEGHEGEAGGQREAP